MAGKWLELLSEIAPGLKRAAIMFNPGNVATLVYMPSVETAARSLNVALFTAPVHSGAEIEAAIAALGREPGGGLFVMGDAFTNVHRVPIILAAARNNVPAVYGISFFPRGGGLLSYPAALPATPRPAHRASRPTQPPPRLAAPVAGGNFAPCGAGASSTLTNVVSGTTTGGTLGLYQTATGGAGGDNFYGPGQGGTATSSLTFNDVTANSIETTIALAKTHDPLH
jgi:hypothetical protein